MPSLRLDKALSLQNNISRERAKILIKEGSVVVNDKVVIQPSFLVKEEDNIVTTKDIEFVGRGYLKIKEAFEQFNFSLANKRILDVGSSTGGFTQFCLEQGAKEVVAIDVGRDQMVDQLREDRRVVLMEGTNIKDVKRDDVGDIDFVVVDLSFISLTKVIDSILNILEGNSVKEIFCLIKPQFELGNRVIGGAGVVKSIDQILLSIDKVVSFFKEKGLFIKEMSPSSLLGKKGNIEIISLFSSENGNIDIRFMKESINRVKKESK